MSTAPAFLPTSPVATRLSALTPLGPADLELLARAEQQTRKTPARREIAVEGEPIREQRAILQGWACRQRILIDGRRQILGFLLPGDLLGVCSHRNPIATTSIVAVTGMICCPAPDRTAAPGLPQAYALSAAMEEWYFLAQITRLGRLDAYQRIADWLLETQSRLALAGVADVAGGGFPLPLSQEMLGDTLGLTSVHVNRTLQALRRDGLLDLRSGMALLPDRARLAKLVDYRPAPIVQP